MFPIPDRLVWIYKTGRPDTMMLVHQRPLLSSTTRPRSTKTEDLVKRRCSRSSGAELNPLLHNPTQGMRQGNDVGTTQYRNPMVHVGIYVSDASQARGGTAVSNLLRPSSLRRRQSSKSCFHGGRVVCGVAEAGGAIPVPSIADANPPLVDFLEHAENIHLHAPNRHRQGDLKLGESGGGPVFEVACACALRLRACADLA